MIIGALVAWFLGLGVLVTLLGTREIRADLAFHRQISRAGICAHCNEIKARRAHTSA